MRTLTTSIFLLGFFLVANSANPKETTALKTIYWEPSQLLKVKSKAKDPDKELKKSLSRLRKNADIAIRNGPFSVTFKKESPPSGDKHDYMSFSRYWWPDPDKPDGLPYIRRDGEVNVKLRQRGDRDQIGMLFDNVEALSIAYYLLGDEKYAERTAKLIRAWFLDPETRMNPHLQFGQAVPGRSVGRGVGILDTRGFIKLIDALSLISDSNALTAQEQDELKQWFVEYLAWLRTSELGKEEAAASNNHGSWYAAQTACIALFVGDIRVAREVIQKVQSERIKKQFLPDGSQPAELKRTQSLHYSFFNLEALSIVARAGEQLGIDLWNKTEQGNGLQPGLDYLMPYVLGKIQWPHPQIREFSLSRGTINLLRMASVRYSDSTYLEPIGTIKRRHPDQQFGKLLFRARISAAKFPVGLMLVSKLVQDDQTAPAEVEITVIDDSPELKLDYNLPSLTEYSAKNIASRVPQELTGTAQVGPTEGEKILEESFRKDRLKDFQKRQGTKSTQVIKLQGGAISLPEVVRQLDDKDIASIDSGVVTLRLPLFVKPNAALVIDGKETPELRLSTDRGAFIANAGSIYILNTKVTSWDEEKEAPTEYVDKKPFRPFISSYIRSRTYLAGSTFHHLGYHAPTSYGLSLSSHPERNDHDKMEEWPTGKIVDCEFHGLYYGFYSYEARNVAIVNNIYSDCVLYGIDPHDRSTELIIARNTATGTREKHGIIGSRGISNSFIFENTSSDNYGSGIMLDRQCSGNVVCNNKVLNNGQGIAIYESSSNILANNLIVQNKKSGIRVRNSKDVVVTKNSIVANGDYGLEASAKRLDNHDSRSGNNDAYEEAVSVTIRDNIVAGNNRGIIKGQNVTYMGISQFNTSIDLGSLKSDTRLEDINMYPNRDEYFGSDLKRHADELERVFDSGLPFVEYSRIGADKN